MSIYVTGDYHGGFQRFTAENFPQQVWNSKQKLNRDKVKLAEVINCCVSFDQ